MCTSKNKVEIIRCQTSRYHNLVEIQAINIRMEGQLQDDEIYSYDLYEDEVFVINDGT